MNSFSGSCPVLRRSTNLPRLRPLRDALVEEAEFLDTGVRISPFSDGLRTSLMDTGRGPGPGPGGTGSWITMTSSLLCWPRCSLAKSNPFTLGACNWGQGQKLGLTGCEGSSKHLIIFKWNHIPNDINCSLNHGGKYAVSSDRDYLRLVHWNSLQTKSCVWGKWHPDR